MEWHQILTLDESFGGLSIVLSRLVSNILCNGLYCLHLDIRIIQENVRFFELHFFEWEFDSILFCF